MSRNKTDFSQHKALEILLEMFYLRVDNVSSLQKLTQIFLEILMKKERELFFLLNKIQLMDIIQGI